MFFYLPVLPLWHEHPCPMPTRFPVAGNERHRQDRHLPHGQRFLADLGQMRELDPEAVVYRGLALAPVGIELEIPLGTLDSPAAGLLDGPQALGGALLAALPVLA